MAIKVTTQELAVVQHLADAWNAYQALPEEHPMDRQEFCTAIHQCQDKLLARSARRSLNEGKAD